jgi:hypothetical protein
MSEQRYKATRPVDLHGPHKHLEEGPPSRPPEESVDTENDLEIKALKLVLEALSPINPEARRRVLQWASDRFL